MKLLKIGLLAFILSNSLTAMAGSDSGGGGGKKEPLFKTVAANITSWIKSGNADALEDVLVEEGLTLSMYKTEMLKVLANYNIAFTDKRILVNGYEKTCKGYVNKRTKVNEIICNNTQFGSDNQEEIGEIYRQVHHEFAGLACQKISSDLLCVERNKNENSDYKISDHITDFLEKETVLRLPVVPGGQPKASRDFRPGGSTACGSSDNLVHAVFEIFRDGPVIEVGVTTLHGNGNSYGRYERQPENGIYELTVNDGRKGTKDTKYKVRLGKWMEGPDVLIPLEDKRVGSLTCIFE